MRSVATSTLALVVALVGAGCVTPPTGDAPDAGPSDNGLLVGVERVAALTQAELQALVSPDILVENGYTIFSITYRTQGTDATATVTLPDAAAPDDGFAVVANAHGTIGLDDPCRLSGTVAGAALAALFGARGAIGVAPDYVGLGGPGLHPYLHVESEGRAVLDAIRAARALAAQEGVPSSSRAAVVGLSQGGHAALATGAIQPSYAPDIDLRAVGAAAPASGFREHWGAIGVAGDHQVYYAMLMYAFAREAGLEASAVFAPDFAAIADDVLTTRCAWSPRLDANEPLLPDVLPSAPAALYRDDARQAFGGRTEAAWADDGFARRRLAPFATTAAVRVWQGDADTTVLPAATAELVEELRTGGVDIELTVVPDGTHLDTAFGFLGSLDRAREQSIAWVREQLSAAR